MPNGSTVHNYLGAICQLNMEGFTGEVVQTGASSCETYFCCYVKQEPVDESTLCGKMMCKIAIRGSDNQWRSTDWQTYVWQRTRDGSNVRYSRTDNWMSTKWRITWVFHMEQCPEWLCSWDFTSCLQGVPRQAFPLAKRQRGWIAYALSFLQQYSIHSQDFLERIVTGDEMQVHHSATELKCASTEWNHPVSPWTSTTINMAVYNATVEHLQASDVIILGCWQKGVLLLHHNTHIWPLWFRNVVFSVAEFEPSAI